MLSNSFKFLLLTGVPIFYALIWDDPL